MDYEYRDSADTNEIQYFVDRNSEYHFLDEDVKEIFSQLIFGEIQSQKDSEFSASIRKSDINDSRITRICRGGSDHIFKIQFLNSDIYILRFNTQKTFDVKVNIMSQVAKLGVQVPINYLYNSVGVKVHGKDYFCLLQEYVEGRNFVEVVKQGIFDAHEKEQLLWEMGQHLKIIHSVKSIEGISSDNKSTFFVEALTRLDGEREVILSEGICDVSDFEELYEKLESLKDISLILGSESYGLIHSNYYPQNIIVKRRKNNVSISGILNWGNAQFNNIFFDFALWDYFCGENFLIDSVVESYGVDHFNSAEAKVNIELTLIAALISEFCEYLYRPQYKASLLGLWQRLDQAAREATY